MVECQICKRQFTRITHTHLKTHNITLDEYGEQFPNASTVSEELRAKFATNTEEFFIAKFGDDGKQRYENHRQMLADKNTFEYKREHHGMTEQEFDQYNKNRACSLENFIKRHGVDVGTAKWAAYCEKQRTAGISRDWFVNKYGEHLGNITYEKVCNAKRHNLDNFRLRYGDEEGMIRFQQYVTALASRFNEFTTSALEREVVARVKEQFQDVRWYDYTSKQFAKWSHELNRVVMFDCVSPELKLAIEINGDYWHCNPAKYAPDFVHPHRKQRADYIWNEDHKKIQAIEREGYRTFVVWELEWKQNSERVMESLINYVKR